MIRKWLWVEPLWAPNSDFLVNATIHFLMAGMTSLFGEETIPAPIEKRGEQSAPSAYKLIIDSYSDVVVINPYICWHIYHTWILWVCSVCSDPLKILHPYLSASCKFKALDMWKHKKMAQNPRPSTSHGPPLVLKHGWLGHPI